MTFEELTNEEKDALITEAELNATNTMSIQYLKDTDWYVTRQVDTGVPMPDDIKQKRQEARASIQE